MRDFCSYIYLQGDFMIDISKIEQLARKVYCMSYIMKLLADDVFNDDCTQGSEFIYIFSSCLYNSADELFYEFVKDEDERCL